MRWREQDGIRWLEAEMPGARAAFTTRLGGVSEGDFQSLNVGIKTEDEPDRVLENRRRICTSLDRELGGVLIGHQVHGAGIARHDAPQQPSPFADGVAAREQVDAQVTTEKALTPLVQVADCLPIALAGEGGVAMAHGGWRGLAAGVVASTAEAIGARAAAIGPGVGACCYEVGDEVLEAFSDLDAVARGRMLDLTAVARAKLAAAGVETVSSADLCTSCSSDLFFSHRRDKGRTGRQAGLAWLE